MSFCSSRQGCDIGEIMSDLVLSNLTIQGHPVGVFYEDPIPPIAANTVRVRTSDGMPPIKNAYATYDTATLVSGTIDVYDVYKSGTNFGALLYSSTNVVEIIAANTTNVTDMSSMFAGCSNLTTISLFDTSNVTGMNFIFYGCRNVESGALALYQQASSQANPPTSHSYAFRNCGIDTTTGAAELAQIPDDWK